MDWKFVSRFLVDVHLVAGIITNSLLLFAIYKFSKQSLGTYKYLLATFSSFDVLLILFHALANPSVVIVDSTFGVVTDSFLQSKNITILYCACFTVPFALMNIHFIYRFWAIRKPHLIALFSKKWFIALVFLWPISGCATWFVLANFGMTGRASEVELLRDEYERSYGKVIEEAWIFADFWPEGKLNIRAFCMITCNVIMIASFSLAVTLALLTYLCISLTALISETARKSHLKLFYAVCAQTFVPLVLVYIPYFCVNNLAFLRLAPHSIDRACMQLTACFPAWDAIIVILLIRDYRMGLRKWIGRRNNQALPNTLRLSSTNGQ